jgi:enamine deaminase RidA (YjgF/YER057c/UK114 family)
MQRTPANLSNWSLNFGYNQSEIIEDAGRQLKCAGQTSVDSKGNQQHPKDMRRQIMLALKNLETFVKASDVRLADIIHSVIYATDVEAAQKHFDVLGARFGSANATPPMTLVSVTCLAVPELIFEIGATAAD